ncbi:MAG TPA: hypothetical protein P5121_18115, partial [Caldilineaceae bacterium]|nr:hypothetical protein [Caldilineaceae bacterium]
QIRPELALMYLAGDPVDALAMQALQAGEYATSQALVTFGASAVSNPNVTLVLQLAQRTREADNRTAALQLLRKGRAMAILATALTPDERAEALMVCATNFLALDQEAEAIDAARQVQRIAEQTPDMLPAVRSRLLQDLALITNQLPDDLLRQQVRELARNPYITPSGIVIQEPLPFADGSIEFEQQLTDLIQTRQQLSRQLAERMIQAPVADLHPLVQALAQALQAEDSQRTLYFTQLSSSENLTFSLQFYFINEYRRWLLLKLAVAQRAFGLSLVPEWEAERATIVDELVRITDDLEADYLTLAQSEAEPLRQSAQRIAIMRWFALQTELGLYPQRSAEVDEALRMAQNELSQLGTSAALAVSYHTDATPPGFRINSNR